VVSQSMVRTVYTTCALKNPPLNLTLNQHVFNERGALSHLGIQVASTDDVLAIREQWTEEGLLTRDEMQTSCCYALQDKTWVRDPDGNEWEVFVVLEDNLAETAPCECGTKVEANAEAKNSDAAQAGVCCSAPTPIEVTNEANTSAACCG